MNKTHRSSDVRGEKALGLFLDKYLYDVLKNNGEVDHYERIYDKKLQIKGTDVKISIDGVEYRLDEKAQLYYINRPKDTFIVEIDYIDDKTGETVTGWFVSKDNETDIYAFAWINKAKNTRPERMVAHDFDEVTVYFVKKENIKRYLMTLNISDADLVAMARDMRKTDTSRKDIGKNKVCLVRSSSDDYVETPINLIIPRDILAELALKKYFITRKNVTSIEK